MDKLQHTGEALRKQGCSTEEVDRLVTRITVAPSAQVAQSLLAQLEPEANKLGWPYDRDYSALALQKAAPEALPEVRRKMLQFALGRAEWCASCATSGGEGLARYEHVRELAALLVAQA